MSFFDRKKKADGQKRKGWGGGVEKFIERERVLDEGKSMIE